MKSFLFKKIIAYCLVLCTTVTLFGLFPVSATGTDYSAAYAELQANVQEVTVTQKSITIGSTTQTGWQSAEFDTTKPWAVELEHTYSGSKSWYVWGKLSRFYVGLTNNGVDIGQYGTDAFKSLSHAHTSDETYTYAFVVVPQESGLNAVIVFSKEGTTYTKLGETVLQNMSENANNTAHNFITTQNSTDGSTVTDSTFKYYGTAVTTTPDEGEDGGSEGGGTTTPGEGEEGGGTTTPGEGEEGGGTTTPGEGEEGGGTTTPDPVNPALFAEVEKLPVTPTAGSDAAAPIWDTVDFHATEPWAVILKHTYSGSKAWYIHGKLARLYVGLTNSKLQVGKYTADWATDPNTTFRDIARTHTSGTTYTYAFAMLPQEDGVTAVIYAKDGDTYTELARTVLDTAGDANNLKSLGTSKWSGTDTEIEYYAKRVRWNIEMKECTTSLNQVNISGVAAKFNEPITATLLQRTEENPEGVVVRTETKNSDATGNFAFEFKLDPDIDAGGSGYFIKLEGDIAKTVVYPDPAADPNSFSLVGSTAIGAAKKAFSTATTDADVLTALTTNASNLGLETTFADILNPGADATAKEIAQNAFLTAYNEMKDAAMFGSNTAFAEKMVAISTKGAKVISAVNAYNTAALSESWGQIKDVMTNTYADCFTGFSTGGKEEKDVYGALCAKEDVPYTPLTSIEAIKTQFDTAVSNAPTSTGSTPTTGTTTPPSFGDGGGSGGGGGGGGSTTVASPSTTPSDETSSGETSTGNVPQELLPAAPFKDTDEAEWAKTYIDYMRNKGYIHGDGSGNFKPNDLISREEFIKMLVTAFEIELKAADENTFTDISEDDWCRDYVFSAQSAGIINGYNDGSFGKGQKITRGDMAVMLHRICASGEYDISAVNPSVVFDDYYLMEDYTKDAINDFVQAGILSGYADGKFGPQNGATRAESCAMIYRLLMKKR